MQHSVPYNEPELLLQVAAGSEDAFRQLFRQYQSRLYTYALKLTRSHELAEDILQEIFLSLWHRRATLPGISHFQAYIYRMAHNEAYHGVRRLAREQLVMHMLSADSNEVAIDQSDRPLLSREIRQHIERLCDQLSPKQREVFRMSKEQGMKLQEIADRMNISINTVKTHLKEAIQFLRSELGKQYGPEALAIFVIWQLSQL